MDHVKKFDSFITESYLINESKGDLRAAINDVLDSPKYSGMEPDDIHEVFVHFVNSYKAEAARKKKGIKPISAEEVVKNFQKGKG
jgi:hypothetical protein